MCYDAASGETIFARDGFDGESTILHNQIRIDDENNILIGGAYVDGEKYKSVNNTGIYLLKLTEDGEELFYTKVVTKMKSNLFLKRLVKEFLLEVKIKYGSKML